VAVSHDVLYLSAKNKEISTDLPDSYNTYFGRVCEICGFYQRDISRYCVSLVLHSLTYARVLLLLVKLYRL